MQCPRRSLSNTFQESTQWGGDGPSPQTAEPAIATIDPYADVELSLVDANVDNRTPVELSIGVPEPVNILSGTFMELVDPQLQQTLSPASGLPTNTVDANNDRISEVLPEQIKDKPLSSKNGNKPVAIDSYGGIWDVEELLAKWRRGQTIWYLVKWKGFPHDDNTWEKRQNISVELVQSFESTYEGNHSGAKLVDKRARRGKLEYLVEWRGRPKKEKSWEKETKISRGRIQEFEERARSSRTG